MAKQEKRARLFGKIGLLCSLMAGLGAIGGLVLIVPRWNFSENLIVMGSPRATATMITLFLTIVLGIGGFLGGLEGAVSEDKKIRSFGWIAFWIGVISTMLAVVLGLCFRSYSM
jgi:hypothetical protein